MRYVLLFAARDKHSPTQCKMVNADSTEEKDQVIEEMKGEWDLIRAESRELNKALK